MRIHYWELSNYNAGRHVGKWFDLDFVSEDQHKEEIEEWLASLKDSNGNPCEEYILGDVEDIPEKYHTEYALLPDFWEYKEAREMSCLSEEAFDAGIELGIEPHLIDDNYVGEFDSKAAFGMHLIGDIIDEKLPCDLGVYFDYESYANDLLIDSYNEHNGHYFYKG